MTYLLVLVTLPPAVHSLVNLALPFVSDMLVKADQDGKESNNPLRALWLLIVTVLVSALRVVSQAGGFELEALFNEITAALSLAAPSYLFIFKQVNKKLGRSIMPNFGVTTRKTAKPDRNVSRETIPRETVAHRAPVVRQPEPTPPVETPNWLQTELAEPTATSQPAPEVTTSAGWEADLAALVDEVGAAE